MRSGSQHGHGREGCQLDPGANGAWPEVFFLLDLILRDLYTLCCILITVLFSLLYTALLCEFMVIYLFTFDGNLGWTLPLAIITDIF